jgi:hypothetical protein
MPVLRTAAAALAATFFTVLVTAHPAAAATSATVTPDTGLVDGQTVTVDGVGYTPGATIGICQGITDGLPLVDNCGTGATAVAEAGPTGDVTSPFDVRRVIFVASLGRNVDCLAEGCELRISEIPSFAGAAFVPISFADVPPTSTPLVTTLTGYREVDEAGQPSAGDLDGIGGARITFPDPATVCFALETEAIELPALAAHIHEAVRGQNGAIVVTLAPPDAGGASSGCVAADPGLVADIAADPDQYYVNVHTGAFPNGAVRGNLKPDSVETADLATRLDGQQEIDANGAPGAGDLDGFGVATVSINDDRVCFSIGVRNIDLPASAAHIHEGGAGVNGPIVVTLVPPASDGRAGGCVTGVPASLRDEIRTNPAGFYVNVHTSAFANGAVRGNLASVVT